MLRPSRDGCGAASVSSSGRAACWASAQPRDGTIGTAVRKEYALGDWGHERRHGRTSCFACLAAPNEEIEHPSFVFLDYAFELGCVELCPGRKGVDVVVTYDEVEEGFYGCL